MSYSTITSSNLSLFEPIPGKQLEHLAMGVRKRESSKTNKKGFLHQQFIGTNSNEGEPQKASREGQGKPNRSQQNEKKFIECRVSGLPFDYICCSCCLHQLIFNCWLLCYCGFNMISHKPGFHLKGFLSRQSRRYSIIEERKGTIPF